MSAQTPEIIHVDIREQDGTVEAAGTVTTISEAAQWYLDRGIVFGSVNRPTPTNSGFSYVRNGILPAIVKPKHRFASVYYKLIIKNRIVAAGSKSAMNRLKKQYPDSFVGIGSPNEPEIGRIWNPAFPAF